MLVATVSEREQAGSSRAEIDYGEEKGGKRIETEMRSKPRNSEWKRGNRRSIVDTEESKERDQEKRERNDQANSVHDVARTRSVSEHEGDGRRRDQRGGAGKS
jgi:hypothetical protein